MLPMNGGTMTETLGHAASDVSTPMHRQKVIRMSSSIGAKTLCVGVDGVALARCTSLHMAPQRQRRIKATCGLETPTSSSCNNRILALECFFYIQEEQNPGLQWKSQESPYWAY